ncbi:MAG TPA: sialidase family protein [Ktedonobacterales bacterium]|nr:sialidase family protein [Ktedonobacterales bacterium]
MRNDMNEQDALPAELATTHQALNDLASAWAVTMPSAEQLAAFARRLPAQQAIVERQSERPGAAPLRQRERTPREATTSAGGRQRPPSRRALAGIAAAVVIVGLLAATLLRLAPSHTGKITREAPTATATAAPPTARLAEEPSQQPPNGTWGTVAHASLIPAPSDGSVVYRADGAVASVSRDGGATWRTLTLPSFTQKTVLSDTVYLRVSETDARVVLLSMLLTVDSYDPAACPPGSRPPAPNTGIGMHGGVLASGAAYCYANFASHDGGASWSAMRLPGDVDIPPNALDMAHIWQLGQSLYGVNIPAIFPSVLGSSVLVSHDLGVTWAYDNTNSPEASAHLCSFLPSAPNSALYALTTAATQGCNSLSHSILWRSDDGGATWNQVAALDFSAFTELVAATPTTSGHGLWLYAFQQGAAGSGAALMSADGGVTWLQTPSLPPAGASAYPVAIRSALADGSMVVAVIGWRGSSISAPPARATFYGWRPGDAAWRPLATTLTTLTASNGEDAVTLARGGSGALDTLWVVDDFENENPQRATTYRYDIR